MSAPTACIYEEERKFFYYSERVDKWSFGVFTLNGASGDQTLNEINFLTLPALVQQSQKSSAHRIVPHKLLNTGSVTFSLFPDNCILPKEAQEALELHLLKKQLHHDWYLPGKSPGLPVQTKVPVAEKGSGPRQEEVGVRLQVSGPVPVLRPQLCAVRRGGQEELATICPATKTPEHLRVELAFLIML
ncbi:hypothetical protein AV530_011632 [Patagioenas fasciata monilis]|uniref:Uncharacterized protein n=1 Tax=Patagioenas fasciata monilis TaxID=372326 RepID=A0A1V4J5M8_PATFA|nr:hypothetical protein AV530_011632 [Patagioenas fasciata monilis]